MWVPWPKSEVILILDLLSDHCNFTASDDFPSDSHVTDLWAISSLELCIRLLGIEPFILERVKVLVFLVDLAIAILFHQVCRPLNSNIKELLIKLEVFPLVES